MKKKIVILFDGPHLPYSPTTIGLYDLLSQHFEVTIIAHSPELFNNQILPDRKVVYLETLSSKTQYRVNRVLFNLYALFDKNISLLRKRTALTEYFYEFSFIRKYLTKEKPDFVIAVDFKNLWFTQILDIKVEFIWLEINKDGAFYKNCNFENIKSVIIQTKERYEHLFNGRKFKTFLIQNAPVYKQLPKANNRKGLVYCGTAWDPFGFYHCLEFIKRFPEHTLNVKGALLEEDKIKVETEYQDLLDNGRLIINDEYLDDQEVVDYLRQFEIGFCFYNFEFDWINRFNYYSAPSGKMFKYFAAGVPVIGQNILGLNPVKEFDCGVLIEDLKPESIKKAVDEIKGNFEYFSKNCLKAAQHYSFDKTAKPFIEYLTKQKNT